MSAIDKCIVEARKWLVVNELGDLQVMFRDASFWQHPGYATAAHVPREGVVGPLGHPVALCNKRIQLDESNCGTVTRAGGLMCKNCLKILVNKTRGR